MRLQTPHWTVSGAVKAGHYHLYKGANCQDAMGFYAETIGEHEFLCGVVSDGCGEGEHSEVGSQMLVSFVLSEIRRIRSNVLFTPANRQALTDVVQQLFHSIVRFIDLHLHLSCPIETNAEIAAYVKEYWLATLVGFIMDEKEGIVFYCGDGEFCINGVPNFIDQQNTPHYIAYACLRDPQSVGVTPDFIPREFTIVPFDVPTTNIIRISSDGFSTKNESRFAVALEREPGLPASLWGHESGHKGEVGLKKWLNSRSDRGYFDDDCAIVVAERVLAND